MPLVSVVIPTYNRCDLLVEAIGSVQRQTVRDLEILVCDDGSSDGSAAAVETLARSDERVRWLPGERSGFPGIVRNRGIRAARGEWIAFQDSDDLWLPHKLERQLGLQRSAPGAQFIYSHAAALWPSGATQRMTPFRIRRSGRVFETFLLYSVVHTPTVLVRRALLERAGLFDERMPLRVGEDYELYLRLAAEVPFHFVDEDLVHCRAQGDSVSADLFYGIDQFQRVLEAVIARHRVPPRLAAEALCRIELRRYKHHLLREYPAEVRRRDLRAAWRRRPGHPLALALAATEALGCSSALRWLLTAHARAGA